ncbi:MAG: hypothetical protein ACI8TX_000757 [Hyphomicrobiaceae bacterium]|jgi:hypothetical protein
MADTAADLVDYVIPQVGVRQWVLTLPFALRYRLACDRTLVTPVLSAFMRAIFRSYRLRVREQYGVPRAKCGAVTFVPRFGGAALPRFSGQLVYRMAASLATPISNSIGLT